MPEQLLNDAQVGPTLEEMGRERMTQGVRADSLGEAGACRRALDRGPRLLAGQSAASIAQEERPATKRENMPDAEQADPRPLVPARQPIERDVPHRDEPLLVALTDDADERAVDGQILAVETDQFADPKTRGVKKFEDGSVAEGVDRRIPGIGVLQNPVVDQSR